MKKRGKDVLTRAEIRRQLSAIWVALEPPPPNATELGENQVAEFPVAITDWAGDGEFAVRYSEPGVVILRPGFPFPRAAFVEALMVSEVLEGF